MENEPKKKQPINITDQLKQEEFWVQCSDGSHEQGWQILETHSTLEGNQAIVVIGKNDEDSKLQKKAVDANVLLSWQDKHQSATDVEPRQRSSRLGRLAAKLFGISNEGRLSHDPQAPLGYNDNGEPKKVTPVTVIDPDGEKPTETRYLKNW